MRVGIGYDIHRLVKGRKLVLGGVSIPFEKGLLGHSDGDALYHAVVDAALGAAGLGDIGEFFSDHDLSHKNKASIEFVRQTRKMLAQKGLAVAQIDSILIAEKPKLSAYKAAMRKNLSEGFGLALGSVNVKAKTNEGLDAVGRGQAIACQAVVVLEKIKKGRK